MLTSGTDASPVSTKFSSVIYFR